MFPAAKIALAARRTYPAARARAAAGELCAGTVDTWLLFNLTGGAVHATDFGNASRTQLFDIAAGAGTRSCCALFGVPPERPAEPHALRRALRRDLAAPAACRPACRSTP